MRGLAAALALLCLAASCTSVLATPPRHFKHYFRKKGGAGGGGKKPCDEVIKVTEMNEVTGSTRYTGFGKIFNDEDANPKSPNFALFFRNDLFSGFQTPVEENKVGLFTGGCVGIEVTETGEPSVEHCTLQATIDGRGTFTMSGDHDYIGNTFLFSITGGSGDFLGAYGTDTGRMTNAYQEGNGPLNDGRKEAYEHEFCLYFPKHW